MDKKIQEIREDVQQAKNEAKKYIQFPVAEVSYLLQQIEIKDKALENARDDVTYLAGEYPTEMWTESEIDRWRGISESAIDNINMALAALKGEDTP
jgi:hypothetical protein